MPLIEAPQRRRDPETGAGAASPHRIEVGRLDCRRSSGRGAASDRAGRRMPRSAASRASPRTQREATTPASRPRATARALQLCGDLAVELVAGIDFGIPPQGHPAPPSRPPAGHASPVAAGIGNKQVGHACWTSIVGRRNCTAAALSLTPRRAAGGILSFPDFPDGEDAAQTARGVSESQDAWGLRQTALAAGEPLSLGISGAAGVKTRGWASRARGHSR